MFSQTFMIGSYMPSLADEQSGKAQEQMAVVDGRNFAWHMNGVFSAHGSHFITAALPTISAHPHIAIIQNRQYALTTAGVYSYADTGAPVLALALPPYAGETDYDLGAYGWSEAYVGTRHWFAHPAVEALVYYDVHDDEWGTYRDDCWSGPIFGITQADNRLVVLLQDAVIWSRFDDGASFGCGDFPAPLDPPPPGSPPEEVAAWQKRWHEADWRCGSGAQSLALIKYGQPYAVVPYNNAWLTFTSMGIMLSQPSYDQLPDPNDSRIMVGAIVYKHEEVSFENIPVGPTAITHVDEAQVIWLAPSGFQSFQPAQGGAFGTIEPWQAEMGRFYAETLMVDDVGRLLDEYCLHYVPERKWLFVSSKSDPGLPHYDRAHVYQLVLDRWGSFDYQHIALGASTGAARERAQQEVQRLGYVYMSPTGRLRLVDHQGPVNSFVRFSPMRLQMPQEEALPPSTVSSVQEIRIGMSGPGTPFRPTSALLSSWRREREENDRATVCKVLISSGDDAETRNVDEGEYAWLVSRDRQSAIYSCHSTGIAHSVLVTALAEDEFFHIRHLELGFFWAGVK